MTARETHRDAARRPLQDVLSSCLAGAVAEQQASLFAQGWIKYSCPHRAITRQPRGSGHAYAPVMADVLGPSGTFWLLGDSIAFGTALVAACVAAYEARRSLQWREWRRPQWYTFVEKVRGVQEGRTACIDPQGVDGLRICYVNMGTLPGSFAARCSPKCALERVRPHLAKHDIVLMNAGSWYMGRGADGDRRHIRDAHELADYVAGGALQVPHVMLGSVMWFETPAEHFETASGVFNITSMSAGVFNTTTSMRAGPAPGSDGASPRNRSSPTVLAKARADETPGGGCTPFADSVAKPPVLRRVSAILRAANVSRAGLTVLPDTWNLTRGLAHLHLGRSGLTGRVDCRHFCLEAGVYSDIIAAALHLRQRLTFRRP